MSRSGLWDNDLVSKRLCDDLAQRVVIGFEEFILFMNEFLLYRKVYP